MGFGEHVGRTRVNVEQAPKRVMRKPTRLNFGEGRRRSGLKSDNRRTDSAGVVTTACMEEEVVWNTGSPNGGMRESQLVARESQAGPYWVAERPVVAKKPGNSGGAKGPWFRVNVDLDGARRVA